MTPLEVTFKLLGPMGEPSMPIHLDSLLAWARYQEALMENSDDPYGDSLLLPLEKTENVFCASVLSFKRETEVFNQMRTRVTNDIAMAQSEIIKKHPVRIRTGSGPLRNDFFVSGLIHASQAKAWCIGNQGRVTELLGKITSLGSERRLGLGEVIQVDVVECEQARTRWRNRTFDDERCVAEGECVALHWVTFPPYWKRENFKKVYAPTTIF